ncbi:MAG: bromoperoxidase [Pseudomonadota bacterium]
MNPDRRQASKAFRNSAAEAAFNRIHPPHVANGDEQRFACANYPMSFTKGLDHDEQTGLIKERRDFEAFRRAIDNGDIEPFTTRVPVPTAQDRFVWEAPTAGLVFDLQGPDAQAVTMAPAPALGSDELDFEMAEVYELALLRDVHFDQFEGTLAAAAPLMADSVTRLNAMAYALDGFPVRARKTDAAGALDPQTVFRGSAPGNEVGPYLSQFLILGSHDRTGTISPVDGMISYGAQTVDQRVPEAQPGFNYMVTRPDWLEIQQGYRVNREQNYNANRRLITTPRDLATYVHFDALYQAYLNAGLILLRTGTPFDPSFANLSANGPHRVLSGSRSNEMLSDDLFKAANAGGFALYGGPHILSLVTEIATRGLKAVRYQKFNIHIRLRPEALAGRLEYAADIETKFPSLCGAFTQMAGRLSATTDKIKQLNAANPGNKASTVLLPMAFPEGSPMHPAYGAGHATVAGACVTILKAYFDTSAVLAKLEKKTSKKAQKMCAGQPDLLIGFYSKAQLERMSDCYDISYVQYRVDQNGAMLVDETIACPLTLEGELNKLAANISIGRNMAGVHYFSDYYDSIRMGEEVAVGMLEEQALGYPTDPFVLTLPTFDGDVLRIGQP